MWTEAEFYSFLEHYGVPITDAIREEVRRDQSDPKKWVIAPGSPIGLYEPDPDQSQYAEELAEQARHNEASRMRHRPRAMHLDGTWFEPEESEGPLSPPVRMRLKPGATIDQVFEAMRPQLRADVFYFQEFIAKHRGDAHAWSQT